MTLIRNISIVIPVFNAADFVTKAVESALMQAEMGEIILVEDGSTDNSFAVCKELSGKHHNVKLFTHANHLNKGAGASRNMGIENASCDFIAFLDADDYYLPDRFSAERKIFVEEPAADGVYGALGFHYYSEEAKEKYNELGYSKLTTVSAKAKPRELFMVLSGRHPSITGHLHLDTVTIKRSVLQDKTEKFSHLALHQDSVFLIQLAINCRLAAGNIDVPIAMRGVHESNRITTAGNKSKLLMWKALYQWARKTSKSPLIPGIFKVPLIREKILASSRLKGFFLLAWHSFANHEFANHKYYFNPCAIYVFKKHYGVLVIIAKERIMKFLFNAESSCDKAETGVVKALSRHGG